MSKHFHHRVCYSVFDRVTFVNGEWQGEDIPEAERSQEDVRACPLVWDDLAQAGADGWELMCVIETQHQIEKQPFVRTLYLKRETQ